ncbi:MAG TPA: hypothetical protein VHB45_16125 [Alloacidobacterium sp.]|nr:hypothetical protein [Alloacidobacterium sp.]
MEDELDRIFSRRDEMIPSSGFVASVMEAVQRESTASQPIAFPWLRALPIFAALAAVLVMLGIAIFELVRMPVSYVGHWTIPPAIMRVLSQTSAGWVAIALVIALLSTWIPVRLIAGKR